ncbi:MAG: hypothetical protein JXQ23_11000 [Clostridia bacterium]|nr:hypothetical protein [Clostridia bacterium]
MEDNMNDNFLIELKRNDIKLSENLSKTVNNALLKTRRKGRVYKYIVSVAAILIIYITLLNTSASFRAFAEGIPGLKETIKWFVLKDDKGLESAVTNDIYDFGPIMIENDEFIVMIDHLTIDQVRIHFSSRVFNKNTDENDYEAFFTLSEYGANSTRDRSFQEGEYISECDIYAKGEDFRDMVFEKGYMEVNIAIKNIGRPNMIVADLGVRRIDFDMNKVLPSKEFDINEVCETEYGTITFNKLILSPTKTEVVVTFKDNDDYFITGIQKLGLSFDNEEHVYPNGSTYLIDNGEFNKTYHLFFNVSKYYYANISEVKIVIEDLFIAAKDGRIFEIKTKEHRPETITYMGEQIIIESVSSNSYLDKLEINYKILAESPLHSINLNIIEKKTGETLGGSAYVSGSYSETELYHEFSHVLKSIPKMDVYCFKIEYPRYKTDFDWEYSFKIK